jgi:hypothetical protein
MILIKLKAAYDEDGDHNYPKDLVIPNEVNGKPVMVIHNDAFHYDRITSIVIPDSVIAIGPGAFSDCEYLTSVTLSNSLKFIPSYCFEGCSSLTSITLPDSITKIGLEAFDDCTVLSSVNLPSGLEVIGAGAFEDTALVSIVIPDSIQAIGPEVFIRSKLTSAEIPNRFVTQLNSIGMPADLQDDIFYAAVRSHLTSNPEFIASIAESIQPSGEGEDDSNSTQSVDPPIYNGSFGGFNDLGHYVVNERYTPGIGFEVSTFSVYNKDSEEVFLSSQLPSIPEFSKPGGLDSYEAYFFNNMLFVNDGGSEDILICYSYDETAETYVRDVSMGSTFRSAATEGFDPYDSQHTNYYMIENLDTNTVTYYRHSNQLSGLAGPKGDTGDVGPQGPAGPQGPQGLDSTAIQALRSSGGSIELNENGSFSINYSIETSDDLEQWQEISNTSTIVQPSGNDKQFLRLTIE